MLELKVKYFDRELPEISFLEQGDWIDLRSAENFDYKAGDFFLIPLGVAMELPPGYEAHLVPRSSTFKNFGIIQTNGTGIIDESYSGNNDQWFMPALAFRKGIINKGDRICQFRILEKMAKVKFTTVEHLANKNRGGHGSTGTN